MALPYDPVRLVGVNPILPRALLAKKRAGPGPIQKPPAAKTLAITLTKEKPLVAADVIINSVGGRASEPTPT